MVSKQHLAVIVGLIMLGASFAIVVNTCCPHIAVTDEGYPATCTADGLSNGSHCILCNKVLSKQVVIPAGHTFSADIHDIEYADGYSTKYCVDCGECVHAPAFPVMSINTEGSQPIVSKENYLGCTVSVFNANSEYEFEDKTAQIKGRGNSTWNPDEFYKNPYKLKFDNKIDLFGNGEAKKWVLLANYLDMSSARNYLAYTMGINLGLPSTTSVQFVNLYINEKCYGVYLICEQVEIGKNRVDISKENGYIVEIDLRALFEGISGKDYFSMDGDFYVIKDPDEISESQFNSVKNIFSNAYSSLNGKDYESIKTLIDVDSFARTYIVNELFSNQDNGHLSTFMYIGDDNKIYSGPIWDFDHSAGRELVQYALPDKLYIKYENAWYAKLFQHDEFALLVSELFTENYETMLSSFNDGLNYMNKYADNFNFDVGLCFKPHGFKLTGCEVCYDGETFETITSWNDDIEFLKYWFNARLKYLHDCYYIG